MNLIEKNCKDIFQAAYEKRYTWEKNFKGYKGKCIFSVNNDTFEGSFVLGKEFKPEIKNIYDEKIKKSIASQLFEVSIHRVKREFEEIHSNNNFNFIKSTEDGIEMRVSGKGEGDEYRVKDNFINRVYRKIHGFIIEIYVQEFFDTGKGYLSKKYTSQQIDPNTFKASSLKLVYEDRFINIGPQDTWILNSRYIKYFNKNQKEEIQKFNFEDFSLLS